MHHFGYRDGEMFCEDVPLARIADEVGTPCYVYSRATLARHFHVLDDAFASLPHLTAFAVKACANLAVLSLLAREGAGADIVSGGELFRARRAGIPPERIVFAGVGKTGAEIGEALDADILLFSVESRAELELINQVAGARKKRARVALRVNPDVDPETHPYIATGLRESKFGFPAAGAVDVFQAADALPNIQVIGLHQHIGSQITRIPPFVDALGRAADLIRDLRAAGLSITHLDIGGGIGIPYDERLPPTPAEVAEAITPQLKDLDVTVVTEPGRVIAGNAGALVTRVLRLKEQGDKGFVVVDAAMNDLLRPSLYDAYHEIRPVIERPAEAVVADVVGPICESGDFLAKARKMAKPEAGELLAVMSAGAYGFTMSSNYNARPRVAEVLVDGGRFDVVRDRETYDDLVRGERIPWDRTGG
jgi:diaminopimelate decarboxylase